MRRSLHCSAALWILALLAAPVPASAAGSAWDAYVTRFLEEHFEANPGTAVAAGRHEFDGRLPDMSPAGREREVERLRTARSRASAFDPAKLEPDERYEREYLLAVLDRDLYWHTEARWPERSPTWYTTLFDPDAYLSKPYAPLEQRLRAYVAYARAVPLATQQIRASLRNPMPAPWIEFASNAYRGYAEFYTNDVAAVFAGVQDPGLQKELAAANAGAAAAMTDLADWLDAQRARATADFGLGPELYARMLDATEQVTVPLARLEQAGRDDLERNLAALREACARLSPGATLEACVARVRAHKPEGGSVAGARRQLPRLKQFLVERSLVTIPSEEEALVEVAPPYQAQNFAYINTPGPYERGLPAVYYIAPPDPRWSPEEQAEYVQPDAALLFVSVHEVWPGHFLQFLHSNRSASSIGKIFVGYAYAEGWAHYAEEMMWDAGLEDGDAEAHVGQLLQALWRNVRYLSSIGMHTRGMTQAESERMFREYAFLDAGNARQQALRGTYDPAYLNYTLGKLMIRKLRDDWTATRGGRKAWREFHDAFLALGGPPIPLARTQLLGPSAGPPL